MQAHLIYNPQAGQQDGHHRVQEAIEFLSARGWRLVIRETTGPADVAAYARQAIGAGAGVVLVVGGDGTVNGAANALAGSDVALGVLPMGTGNVLAAELGMLPIPTPLHRPDPLAAAKYLYAGEQRWIDLGRVVVRDGDGADKTRYFVLWAGIGFDASVTLRVENQLRPGKRLLGPWSFLVAGIDAALHTQSARATLRFDDQVVEEHVVLIGISNAQLYAGSVRLAPRAQMDDGWLDAYIFEGRGLPAVVRHVLRVATDSYRRDPNLETFAVQRMTVETDVPLPVQVDGEPVGTTPVSIDVVPHALKLLVPPVAPAGLFR